MEPITLFWMAMGVGVLALGVALYVGKRQRRPRVDILRILLTVLLLIAAYVPFNHLVALFVRGDPRLANFTAEDYRFYGAFGLTVLLGLFSLVTLFVWRPAHLLAAVLFFGTWATIMLVEIAANALAGRAFLSARDAALEYGFRLAWFGVMVAAMIQELRCERNTHLSAGAKLLATAAVWLALSLVLVLGGIKINWSWDALVTDPTSSRWREVLTVIGLFALAGFVTVTLWWRRPPSGTPAEGPGSTSL